MSVEIEVTGIEVQINEIERVVDRPIFHLTHGFETLLRAQFLDTQEKVHAPGHPGSPHYVPTGSLKASGRTSTDFDGHNWSGEITYGGASTGPNDPVDYAIFEQARGGEHDFMRGVFAFEPAYEEKILEFFRG